MRGWIRVRPTASSTCRRSTSSTGRCANCARPASTRSSWIFSSLTFMDSTGLRLVLAWDTATSATSPAPSARPAVGPACLRGDRSRRAAAVRRARRRVRYTSPSMSELPESPTPEELIQAGDGAADPGQGQMRTAIANALVGLKKEYYGRASRGQDVPVRRLRVRSDGGWPDAQRADAARSRPPRSRAGVPALVPGGGHRDDHLVRRQIVGRKVIGYRSNTSSTRTACSRCSCSRAVRPADPSSSLRSERKPQGPAGGSRDVWLLGVTTPAIRAGARAGVVRTPTDRREAGARGPSLHTPLGAVAPIRA